MAKASTSHRWRFFRAGGFDQVQLDRGMDLISLDQLDQKLWVSLGCPVKGLEFDERTLELIDSDNDGRIRASELIAAARWAGSLLKDPDELVKRTHALPLAAIDESSAEGKTIASSARHLLEILGKTGAAEISVADTIDTGKIFAATRFNGDGVVPAGSADDDDVKKAIEEIVASVGGELDRSGAQGVSQTNVDAFFEAAKGYVDWHERATADAPTVLPLGEATGEAFEAFAAVAPKVDDYFARCRLAAFDARAVLALNGDEKDLAALGPKLLTATAEEVAAFPLARVEPGRALPLGDGVNPAWSAKVAAAKIKAIEPLLGARATLTDADWQALRGRLAPFDAWRASKAGAVVEPLGLPRVKALLAGAFKANLEALIAKDKSLEAEAASIASVEKLVRLHRDLHALAENFVNFKRFYGRKEKASFQAGTLFLDGRSCDLCIKVADAGAHAAMATLSRTYLAYCACTRKADGATMTIAAAFTGGDSDDLMVGRNGVFYDRKGNDWDATIVKLIEHPISVRQAFWLPYKRVAKMIDEQIEKFASSRDKEIQEQSSKNVADAAKATEESAKEADAPLPVPVVPLTVPAKKEGPAPFDVAKFAGIFAAIGLAIGAIGSALAAVATGFLALKWWQMPIAMGGLMLLVSGPSMMLAWLKLRQRNLGPILDANGWAVNARAKMNVAFGASLTHVAALPLDAERSLDDPFADKKNPWPHRLVALAIVIALGWAWREGYVRKFLSEAKAPAVAASAAASPSASASAPTSAK
ncbi:MAG: hypothetical protein ACHREM_17675 [Polyangiales bacterium]